MSEWRADPVTGQWVVIAADEPMRRRDFDLEPAAPIEEVPCPLCEGQEAIAGHEIAALRDGTPPDGPGWRLRVVPNRVPALRVEGSLEPQREGPFESSHGLGAHEVVIETPRHEATWSTMTSIELTRVLAAWRDRMVDLKRDGRLRAVVAFKNHGAKAGARVAHPHSQLVALPIVSPQLSMEISGARRSHESTGRCVYCDLVARETAAGVRLVHATPAVTVLAAYAARSPFELWVVPVAHQARFEEASGDVLEPLAAALHTVLARLDVALERPAYNVVLHSAPFHEAADAAYHWHLEITPRVLRQTGFEVGSGMTINPVAPEEATKVLRGFGP